jgi:hypothetical protein
MSGERIPPSAMKALKSLNGVELAWAQPGPWAMREKGRPQFSNRLSELRSIHARSVSGYMCISAPLAPLSEKKTTNVFS